MKQAHIIMQGKGGVGKSTISRVMFEYLYENHKTVIALDADPINPTLYARIKDRGNVSRVQLIDDQSNRIEEIKFDKMIEEIISSSDDTAVIIDTGASSFLPFISYMSNNYIPRVLNEAGYEVFIHTIVTGGLASSDTFAGFYKLALEFGNETNVFAWVNNYFGRIYIKDMRFSEVPEVKELISKEMISGIIELEPLYELHNEAFLSFLNQGESFNEAARSKSFDLMTQIRIRQVKAKFFSVLDAVLKDENPAEAV